ncbi:tetratricopeptide repeat protein [Thiohalobacter sp.]|uniref:tetratricopeptide repeat protein n=1 Tax=Thiohalobacter sp. TaxID=2025948 RepID=UPI0026329475|nr:tetratricopeptide repeat protein [Thiohalobacter sp.]
MIDLATKLAEASTLCDQGDLPGALNAYQKITEDVPDCAEAWLMRGSLAVELGHVSDGMNFIEKSRSLDPNNPDLYMVLGQISSALGNLAEAVEHFSKAVELDAEDIGAVCAHGEALLRSGREEEALEAFRRAVALDDGQPDVWGYLGYLYARTGDVASAEDAYRKALVLGNRDESLIIGWCLCLQQKDLDDDGVLLLKDIVSRVDIAEIQYFASKVFVAWGLNEEALMAIEKALARDSDNEKYRIQRADVFYAQGDLQKAFELIKPSLERQRPHVEAALVLAKFSHVVGLREGCLKLLNMLAEDPDLSDFDAGRIDEAIAYVSSQQLKGG